VKRVALVFGVALIVAVGAAEAQVSVYSVLGIGFPSRPVGVSARSQGDGIAAIDPGSAMNPGAIALQPRLNVIGVSETTNRSYVADGVAVDGLRDTRFPFFMLEGQLGSSPLVIGLSYSTYTDRSYHIQTGDTITIRDEEVPIQDELSSDGGIADVRAALAWNAGPKLQVGAAVHVLAGSTREEVLRDFGNPAYSPVRQKGDVSYSGFGLSAGAVYTPLARLRVGAAVRRDSKLEISGALLPAFEVQLPWTLTAGFTFIPLTPIRWSVSGSWRSWSRATDDVPSPKADQPWDFNLSAGTGFHFASRRALFEFTVERAIREGGGASERAWQLFFGLTLRP
jgi:hypothetical protein